MTVSSEISRNDRVGNGVLDTFIFEFEIYAKTDLLVYVDGILKTVDVHYTVPAAGINNPAGGTIVFTAGNIPINLAKIAIILDLPLTQLTDYVEGDKFPAETHETALDRLVKLAQAANETYNRCLRLPSYSVGSGQLPTDFIANYFMKVNSTGTGFELHAGLPYSAPAGANKEIQFNDVGILGADADLSWDKVTERLYAKDLMVKGPWVDVRNYVSINAAITAIGATVTTLLIPNAQITAGNVTIPFTLSLKILDGGSIVHTHPDTVTIIGPFEAGLYQVFSGFSPGDVSFGAGAVKEIYPEWWGENTTPGTTDMAIPLACWFAAGAGKNMWLPPATYACSTDLDWPASYTTLKGVYGSSIILFTGATDAIVFPDTDDLTLRGVVIEGIELQTSNAAGGKALNANLPTHGGSYWSLRNIRISISGAGQWTHGLYGDNLQSSEIYSLRIYVSAVTSIYLYHSCNALKFYGTEITGAAFSSRGIDVTAPGYIGDTWWFGGTIQGNFDDSCIRVNAAYPRFYGFHIENTNGTPADGADVAIGTSVITVNGLFHGMYGGSYRTTFGVTQRNIIISDSYITSVHWEATTSQSIVINTLMSTYTDEGTQASGGVGNRRINCGIASGVRMGDTSGAPVQLLDSATPTVASGNLFTNGGSTTITNFTNGIAWQEIKIICEYSVTITDGTNIFLNGSANFVMAATDTLTLIQKADGKWYEISRSDN